MSTTISGNQLSLTRIGGGGGGNHNNNGGTRGVINQTTSTSGSGKGQNHPEMNHTTIVVT